jgi:hypothetical protein
MSSMEIPFEPIIVEVDGNDYILSNATEAQKFVTLVEKHKNFGFKPEDNVAMIAGEHYNVKEVKVYPEAADAFGDYVLL